MQTTVKGIVAAAITAVVLGTYAPALAKTASMMGTVAIANCISPSDAIASAVGASTLDLHDVEDVEWHYDGDGHDYIVTLTSTSGHQSVLAVDAVTGAAHLTS